MIFKQVFDTKSSTYTYIIASAKGREAVIIDPVIENVESYISLLNELDLKLVKVIDTHIHADHITGASKLKQATNCSTLMGEHTPADAVEKFLLLLDSGLKLKLCSSPCQARMLSRVPSSEGKVFFLHTQPC